MPPGSGLTFYISTIETTCNTSLASAEIYRDAIGKLLEEKIIGRSALMVCSAYLGSK